MEQSQDLYITFLDLTEAFDAVSREGLPKTMSNFGCPDRFVKIVDVMMVRVLDDENASDWFQVSNGVKQGCLFASMLFSLMFSAMLTSAFGKIPLGVPIKYR